MILEHRIFFNQAKLAKRPDNTKPTATFTLSLSNVITTGKKFRSIIHKINKTFSSCDFMLCDTLDRYNTMMHATHTNEAEAYKLARAGGDAWLNENQQYLNELTISNKLIRWDEWLNHSEFTVKLKKVEAEFEQNLAYKEAFHITAAEYLSRRSLTGDIHMRLCIRYLQEECAVMLLWADSGYNFELYPALRNGAMQKTYEALIAPNYANNIMLDVKIDVRYKKKKEQEIALGALQSILQYTTGHIYVKDEEGNYLFCNEAQAQSLGLSIENVIGKTDFELSTVDIAKQYREADLFVIKNGKPTITEEQALYNNKYVTYLSTKSPLYGKNKEIMGVVGTSFDITDRKEKEKLFQENQAYKTQEKQQQEFKTIVDHVAHDIRSPLASLQMLIQICTELSEANKTALRKSCERISDIANNLLRYFKPEYSTDVARIEKASITQLKTPQLVLVSTQLLDIIIEKRYEYSLQEVKIIPKFNNNSNIFINADSQAFKRAISNIINNAVDALDKGAGEIAISLNTVDDKVQIIVEDNGTGMPEAIQYKILNKIPVTFGKANGHGIGYDQIHDMLIKSNGTLHIQSKQNIGTKITLTFPNVAAPDKSLTFKIQKNILATKR